MKKLLVILLLCGGCAVTQRKQIVAPKFESKMSVIKYPPNTNQPHLDLTLTNVWKYSTNYDASRYTWRIETSTNLSDWILLPAIYDNNVVIRTNITVTITNFYEPYRFFRMHGVTNSGAP